MTVIVILELNRKLSVMNLIGSFSSYPDYFLNNINISIQIFPFFQLKCYFEPVLWSSYSNNALFSILLWNWFNYFHILWLLLCECDPDWVTFCVLDFWEDHPMNCLYSCRQLGRGWKSQNIYIIRIFVCSWNSYKAVKIPLMLMGVLAPHVHTCVHAYPVIWARNS